METIKKILKLLFLNILWLIFSIPLITIGSSTSAAFYVTFKIFGNEDVSVFKMFVKSFKENFKQGTIMWLFSAPCIYASFLLWQLVIKSDDRSFFVIIAAIVYTLIIFVIIIYTFPIIARYKNSLKNIIKNAVGISLMYLKSTLILLLIVLLLFSIGLALYFWNPYILCFYAFFVPELFIIFVSKIVMKIFLEVEKKNEEIKTSEIKPK